MTRVLVFALVTGLSVSSVHADSLKDAISRAATVAALQQAQQQRSEGIPRGLFWTGIGLLGAGGLYLAIGAATDDEEMVCVSISSRLSEDCVSIRKVALITGGVLAGTGGALLGIGIAKSHHSPSVSFGPDGVVIRQRVPLKF